MTLVAIGKSPRLAGGSAMPGALRGASRRLWLRGDNPASQTCPSRGVKGGIQSALDALVR